MLKKIFVTVGVFILLCASLCAQSAKSKNDLDGSIRELQDRVALKELVDQFSILADRKDVHTQVQLFTPDAILESVVNGKSAGILKGRDQLERTFAPFLAPFQTVYHFNGQQSVAINGDKATGIRIAWSR